jgi:hypothetical protein
MRSLGRRCGLTVFVGRGVVVEKARGVAVSEFIVVVDDDDDNDGEGWIWERHRRVEAMRMDEDGDREAEAARAVNEGSAGAMAVVRSLLVRIEL